MRTIELANGARYDSEWCGESLGLLAICLTDEYTAAEIFAAFSDPANTARIVSTLASEETVYEGYTIFKALDMNSWYGGRPIITLEHSAEGA